MSSIPGRTRTPFPSDRCRKRSRRRTRCRTVGKSPLDSNSVRMDEALGQGGLAASAKLPPMPAPRPRRRRARRASRARTAPLPRMKASRAESWAAATAASFAQSSRPGRWSRPKRAQATDPGWSSSAPPLGTSTTGWRSMSKELEQSSSWTVPFSYHGHKGSVLRPRETMKRCDSRLYIVHRRLGNTTTATFVE